MTKARDLTPFDAQNPGEQEGDRQQANNKQDPGQAIQPTVDSGRAAHGAHRVTAAHACRVKQEKTRRSTLPTIVADAEGTVVALSAAAQALLGAGVGRACWELVGRQPTGKGLPCGVGCVGRLLEGGIGVAAVSTVELHGGCFQLCCTPVAGYAVCTLARGSVARSPRGFEQLTPRERQVLTLIAEGLETQMIAERLGISARTVSTHVENMQRKLGAETRAGLVATAFRLGLLA